MGRILVYTTTGCPRSHRLKSILTDLQISFVEVNIQKYPLAVDELAAHAGGDATVPRIFFNDTHIGGLREILDRLEKGTLESEAAEILKSEIKPSSFPLIVPEIGQAEAIQRFIKFNVVLDNVLSRVRAPDSTLPRKKGKKGFTFKGSDLVTWIERENKSKRDAALKIAEKFKEQHYIIRAKEKEKEADKPFIDDTTLWQFVADRDPNVLNNKCLSPPLVTSKTGVEVVRSLLEVSDSLLASIQTIADRYTISSGLIDSMGVFADKDWGCFIDNLHELCLIQDLVTASSRDILLFFLQIYRVFRLHLMIVNGGLIGDAPAEFVKLANTYSYRIQTEKYSLMDIVNVIRTGRPPQIKDKDKKGFAGVFKTSSNSPKELRKQFFLPDFRSLFLLLHPAYSSPPIQYVTFRNLDFALQWNTESFSRSIYILEEDRVAILPRCFQVIRKDHGGSSRDFLFWLLQFLPPSEESKLLRLLRSSSEEIEIAYKKRKFEVGLHFLPYDADHVDAPKDTEAPTPEELAAPAQEPEQAEMPEEVVAALTTMYDTQNPTLDLSDSSIQVLSSELLSRPASFLRKLDLSKNSLMTLSTRVAQTFGHVAFLHLSRNRLKEVPAALGELRTLEYADFSSNKITYISNKFCTLRHLKTLYLNDNEIEYLPLGFASLRGLEDINLSNNKLTSLPHNFGELSQCEILDLHSNQLTSLPIISGMALLEELSLRKNHLKEFFSLADSALPSLQTLDFSQNELKEVPPQISTLVYLTDLNLSSNPIKRLPTEFCELYSLKTLDVSDNDIAEPPQNVCSKGISAIRQHFNWDKEVPVLKPLQRGVIDSTGRGRDKQTPALGTVGKSLSTREKRALLMVKTKTAKLFDKNQLSTMREKYGANDINAMIGGGADDGALMSQLDTAPAQAQQAFSSPVVRSSVGKADLTDWLVLWEKIDNYWVELPGSVSSQVTLQDFNYLPIYQKLFHHKPHSIFFGLSPVLGPVVVVIMEIETEMPAEKETTEMKRSHTVKSKSLSAFGSRKVKAIANLGEKARKPSLREFEPKKSEKDAKKPTISKRQELRDSEPASRPHLPFCDVDSYTSGLKKRSLEKMQLPSSKPRSASIAVPVTMSESEPAPLSPSLDVSEESPQVSSPTSPRTDASRSEATGMDSTRVDSVRVDSARMETARMESARNEPVDPFDLPELDSTGYPLNVRAFIRSPQKDVKLRIPIEKKTRVTSKHFLKLLKEMHPEYAGISFKQMKGDDVKEELLTMEMRLSVKGYKFGILYAKPGQETENEFFDNREVGPNFKEFLEWIGTEIPLKGWANYNAGLDVEHDSTGSHSLFTEFQDYAVMFHVSTYLPWVEDDEQQLARKRHLGNDVVVIIFQEGPDHPPFDPRIIHSYFNHVFFVIRKDETHSQARGVTTYRCNTMYKDGVQPFRPGFSNPPLLEKNEESRRFLLTKFVNSERASYSAPGFAKALERTRGQLLNKAFTPYTHVGLTASSVW